MHDIYLLSYNNMSNKGNERSNAKIADEDIIQILESKGRVTVFEQGIQEFLHWEIGYSEQY